jgi:hypothetical protein
MSAIASYAHGRKARRSALTLGSQARTIRKGPHARAIPARAALCRGALTKRQRLMCKEQR